jgi:lipopolysaccharide biosynthesis glycosyltransferase
MIIVCATDRDYVEITGVMLGSLARNGGVPNARVIVYGDRLWRRDVEMLKQAGGPHVEVIDIGEDRKLISHLPTMPMWPTMTYVRLIAPEIVPQSCGRLLYLDSDVLITSSIRSLCTLPMNGHVLAAAAPRPADTAGPDRTDNSKPYFNDGVLLVDIPKWRAAAYTRRTLDWLEKNPNCKYQDQDALNAVAGGRFLWLDPAFNSKCYGSKDPHRHENVRSSVIIHFTGRFKPTQAECQHPAFDIFLEHRKATPWGQKPLESRRHRIWRERTRHLKRLGLELMKQARGYFAAPSPRPGLPAPHIRAATKL